jgi:hypothetical protein
MELSWQGPFALTSRDVPTLLDAPEGAASGLYFWAVRTLEGPLPHYVGETSRSFAARHLEHFRSYASGIYSTRDSDAFVRGEEVILHEGALWRSRPPAEAQPFIDGFAEFARHIKGLLDSIDVYVAPANVDQRMRRRLEGGLVQALYSAPVDQRRLFPPGYRIWRRTASETPLLVHCRNPPQLPGFPAQFEV